MTPGNISIEATERSPQVEFNPARGVFTLRGESYPEDAARFFGPILKALEAYLAQESVRLTVNLQLLYFNSSSAKALMSLFQIVEHAAGAGREVRVNWYYQEEDETMQEFGEDFSEDIAHADFRLIVA